MRSAVAACIVSSTTIFSTSADDNVARERTEISRAKGKHRRMVTSPRMCFYCLAKRDADQNPKSLGVKRLLIKRNSRNRSRSNKRAERVPGLLFSGLLFSALLYSAAKRRRSAAQGASPRINAKRSKPGRGERELSHRSQSQQLFFTSLSDASDRIPPTDASSRAGYIAAWSRGVRDRAFLGWRAGRRLPPACECRTHDAGCAGAHPAT